MPKISSVPLSPFLLSSASDALHQDTKKILNNNVESDNSIKKEKTSQLNARQLKEKMTATENHIKITTAPSNNHLAASLFIPNQPITMTLPPSETAFFYKIAHEDQNRLLSLLLNQQGYATDHINKTQLPRNLINQTIDYLSRYKNEPAKRLELIKQLLIPLGEYGANEGEDISSNHQQAILANWLQRAVLGMPSDTWFLQQIAENKSLLNHENLRKCQFERLNSQTEFGMLSSKAKDYYKEHVLSRIMPTLMLQPKTLHEQQRLQQMKLDQPEWGYLHVGAMLLKESSTALNNISLDDMINVGMMLEVLLTEQKVPAQYAHYFKLPAIIHHQLKTINKIDIAKIDEQDMSSIYHNYFNELHQFGQDNPLIQLTNLLQHWQSRPELASQQLKQYDISADWLDNYLYKNQETEYQNRQGKNILLPNIDTIFKQQNQHIADIFKQTDHILLPQALHSLSETEQSFIQHAKVERVIVEYNAQDNMIHSLPPGVSSAAKDGLIIHLPDSIDMLKCTLNGEERIYALEKEQEMGNYKLSRVDRNRDLIFDLIKDHKNTRHNRNFTLKIYSPTLLKEADDVPQIAIEKLTTLHSDKLFKKLQEQGYQKTTHQKVDDFFLSLIPFYTCITEAQKGNTAESAIAGYFDILSFLPFLGKGLQIGGRFSIAMGEATTGALKTAATKATIAQALREAGKQFVKEGIPHITRSVPAQTYIGLGVDFMRTADPGFELLASGGIKGVNALKNAAIKLKPKINSLTSLAEILDKKIKNIPVTPIESLKTTTAYHPGLAKEIPVVNIGQKQGKDIFVQVNTETGGLFGQKYLRDKAGNLELAPISIRERLYHLRTQGLGGKGSKVAAKNWALQSDQVHVDLRKMDLRNYSNEKADLSLADMSGANLTGAKLNGYNLTEANMSNALMMNANLTNANSAKTKLKKANLTKANMSDTSMLEADLTKATLIDANLTGANLSNATLKEVWICGANFTGANLNNTFFTLALPQWTKNNLNTTLNHFDNSRSLLTSIDSIDNQYSELKIKLALQLIRSLDKPNLNLTHITFPLLDIFSKEPFIMNPDIFLFVNKLVGNLKNHSAQFFSTAETAFHPVFKTNIKVIKIDQQQGNDIWIQIDAKKGGLFGEKYFRDTKNNLELAPIQIQKQRSVAQQLSESQEKKMLTEQKALSSTISTRESTYYANNPSPLKQSLSHDDLDWIKTSILKPAKELDAKGPCALTSAGIFTFLNGGGKQLANTFFHETINNAKHGKNSNMKALDLISRLISYGTEVNVDIYLKSIYDKPMIQHGYLAAELGNIAREHPFDINAIRAKIDSMPPGECQMFFIDNYHVITLARDNDNKLWLFDTALNPKVSNFTELQDVTKSGENYATDSEAQTILDKYLHRIHMQPLIITIKHK